MTGGGRRVFLDRRSRARAGSSSSWPRRPAWSMRCGAAATATAVSRMRRRAGCCPRTATTCSPAGWSSTSPASPKWTRHGAGAGHM